MIIKNLQMSMIIIRAEPVSKLQMTAEESG